MATLSLRDQLRTAQQTRLIAGPHGSQFVHAQFMPMRSTVIECFSPIHVNPSILQICRALRHDYRQIVSRCNLVYPTRMVAIVRSTARTWRWCSTRCRKSSSVLDLKLKWESHAVQHTKNSHEYLAHY